MSEHHISPCFGGHLVSISCEEATEYRKQEEQKLFYCSKSDTHKHSFSGGTVCDYGCGRYIQELIPDAHIGE